LPDPIAVFGPPSNVIEYRGGEMVSAPDGSSGRPMPAPQVPAPTPAAGEHAGQ